MSSFILQHILNCANISRQKNLFSGVRISFHLCSLLASATFATTPRQCNLGRASFLLYPQRQARLSLPTTNQLWEPDRRATTSRRTTYATVLYLHWAAGGRHLPVQLLLFIASFYFSCSNISVLTVLPTTSQLYIGASKLHINLVRTMHPAIFRNQKQQFLLHYTAGIRGLLRESSRCGKHK